MLSLDRLADFILPHTRGRDSPRPGEGEPSPPLPGSPPYVFLVHLLSYLQCSVPASLVCNPAGTNLVGRGVVTIAMSHFQN